VGKDSLVDMEKLFRRLVKEGRLFLPAQAVREYARHRTKYVADIYEQLKKRISAIPEVPPDFAAPMFQSEEAYKSTVDSKEAQGRD
jgi:hypothetical protein